MFSQLLIFIAKQCAPADGVACDQNDKQRRENALDTTAIKTGETEIVSP
jgi:hypothetical protein